MKSDSDKLKELTVLLSNTLLQNEKLERYESYLFAKLHYGFSHDIVDEIIFDLKAQGYCEGGEYEWKLMNGESLRLDLAMATKESNTINHYKEVVLQC